MRVGARSDYALRALAELASRDGPAPVPAEELAAAQDVPVRFLLGILRDLRDGGVVVAVRGRGGGYRLARPASRVTLAEVVRLVDGPLAQVQGVPADRLGYAGAAAPLREVWVAVRAALREVLEGTTLDDVVTGRLPAHVRELVAPPDAWRSR